MPLLHRLRGGIDWLRRDWRAEKCACFGALLLLLTGMVEAAYYANTRLPVLDADTPAYLHVVGRISAHPYLLVDAWRLPGYPLFITLVYALAGRGNLVAVSIAQAVLFALATLECYLIAVLLFRRAWIAFLLGLLIGTNVILIGYIQPIMTEGLALWELVTLTLTLLWFLRTMRVRAFCCIVACQVLLFLTRPEWVYLPVPLLLFVLLVAWQQGVLRLWLRRVLVALALIYVVVLAYIGVNGLTNGYFGLTAVTNFNLFGKVLQYNMQDEGPVQDVALVHQLDRVIAHVDRDPYHVLPYLPSLAHDHATPAGQFAQTIILHHPLEFMVKSVPLVFSSLTDYYDSSPQNHRVTLGRPLAWLKSVHRLLHGCNILFPLCALAWLVLLFSRRTSQQYIVLAMGVIALLSTYSLLITTVGGYRPDDYMRFHIVFDALLILTIYGSLFLVAAIAVRRLAHQFARGCE